MRRRAASTAKAATGIDLSHLDSDEAPKGAIGVASTTDDESPRSARDVKFADLAKVAKAFTQFRPASEVLTRVRAVPTIFPQFDHATRVGGLPIERFSLLHGPSGGGKTYWTIGMLLSFLMKNHFAVLIDAERTTPITWLEKAMGEYAQHPFFQALRPTTYEQTVEDVRHFLNTLAKQRKAGNVSSDTSALVVVDSIRKLVPKDQWKRIMEDAKREGSKDTTVRDRAAQIKAQMNSAWMDEIVPLLEETQSAMLVIARETDDPDAPPPRAFPGRPAPEKKKKTGGGSALFYDASMDMRSSLVKAYGKSVGEGDEKRMVRYGDVHRLDITKSKVSGKGEVYRTSINFHISNGLWVPEGFDRARDLLDFARSLDIVEGTGWLKFGRNKWQGEDAAVKKISASPELLADIEAACREEAAKKMDKVRA